MSCHVALPSSTTLATMRCQSSRFSEALMSSVRLTLSFHDSLKLSRYISIPYYDKIVFFPDLMRRRKKTKKKQIEEEEKEEEDFA